MLSLTSRQWLPWLRSINPEAVTDQMIGKAITAQPPAENASTVPQIINLTLELLAVGYGCVWSFAPFLQTPSPPPLLCFFPLPPSPSCLLPELRQRTVASWTS